MKKPAMQMAGFFYEALSMNQPGTHILLFSYGTLQSKPVQLASFGRELEGTPDVLPGYRLRMLPITDPAVLAASSKAEHPIIWPSGNPDDEVAGTVFRITGQELAAADAYEVSDYKRVDVQLKSGIHAWAYIEA
jgi:hypothetical protein